MTSWLQLPPAEHHEGFTVPGTVADVGNACREAAHDMGLALVAEDSTVLTFRDRFHWLAFPVELAVGVLDHKGRVRVSVSGSSWGGRGADQLAYVSRLVRAFAERVKEETASPASTVGERRNRSAVFAWLTTIQWASVALVIPMVLIPLLLWDGLKPKLMVLAWCWLMAVFPPAAEIIRRRLAGTGGSVEFVALAVSVGAVAVFTPVALGKALGWF